MFYEIDRKAYPTEPTSIIAGSDGIIVAGENAVSLVIAHPLGSPLDGPVAPLTRSDDFHDIIAVS